MADSQRFFLFLNLQNRTSIGRQHDGGGERRRTTRIDLENRTRYERCNNKILLEQAEAF